ncbi:hypothetical protein Aph02nite_91660 [Actinoplanes philippinensis]|uniref:hypothetical protein n=1 Tax=Actinoplanes philippinensis TaxID=35752 RepID=UPI00116052E5|nr:hypothetical protein [Actinoplanes philippinensis]GIE83216.1 hypothetical protein Aph02nite_91660 [Actinoplanes philippinensis]
MPLAVGGRRADFIRSLSMRWATGRAEGGGRPGVPQAVGGRRADFIRPLSMRWAVGDPVGRRAADGCGGEGPQASRVVLYPPHRYVLRNIVLVDGN